MVAGARLREVVVDAPSLLVVHAAARTINEKTLGWLKPPCVTGTAGENEHWYPDVEGRPLKDLEAAWDHYTGWVEVGGKSGGDDPYSAGKHGLYRKKDRRKDRGVKSGLEGVKSALEGV